MDSASSLRPSLCAETLIKLIELHKLPTLRHKLDSWTQLRSTTRPPAVSLSMRAQAVTESRVLCRMIAFWKSLTPRPQPLPDTVQLKRRSPRSAVLVPRALLQPALCLLQPVLCLQQALALNLQKALVLVQSQRVPFAVAAPPFAAPAVTAAQPRLLRRAPVSAAVRAPVRAQAAAPPAAPHARCPRWARAQRRRLGAAASAQRMPRLRPSTVTRATGRQRRRR